MTLMSRSPASDICSVRGIGVALIAITSTLQLELAQQLLLLDAEALLLVDDRAGRGPSARTSRREQPVRADQDVDLALVEAGDDLALLLGGVRKRLTTSIVNG